MKFLSLINKIEYEDINFRIHRISSSGKVSEYFLQLKNLRNIKFDVASLSKNENKTGHDKWYTNYSSSY